MTKLPWGPVVLFVALLPACPREERPARVAASSDPASRKAPTTNTWNARARPEGAAPGTDPALAFNPPAIVHLPRDGKPNEKLPLVIVLHGYGVSSALVVAKSRLEQLANEKRFAYLVPEGNRDSANRPFWNAGPSCCNIDRAKVDDRARLIALIESAVKKPTIDPERVFLIGYSNGGFMAHQLACAIGNRLAAVVSISGSAPAAEQRCEPSSPLAFVEIRGDLDPVVRYAGGTVFDREDFAEHASALSSARSWAARLACEKEPKALERRDLEPHLSGAETAVLGFEGCRGAVELWTVHGGAHYIALERAAFEAIWGFLESHPKPASAMLQ